MEQREPLAHPAIAFGKSFQERTSIHFIYLLSEFAGWQSPFCGRTLSQCFFADSLDGILRWGSERESGRDAVSQEGRLQEPQLFPRCLWRLETTSLDMGYFKGQLKALADFLGSIGPKSQ